MTPPRGSLVGSSQRQIARKRLENALTPRGDCGSFRSAAARRRQSAELAARAAARGRIAPPKMSFLICFFCHHRASAHGFG
eukprot:6579354-Prymnesium_polylepis.1